MNGTNKDLPLEEVLHSDMTELPEDIRKKLSGESRERDDEPTQVTKLIEELEECSTEAQEELTKSARSARRVSRLTRHPQSYPKLKAVISVPPPSSTPSSDKK